MQTVSEIIDGLGGTSAVAAAMELTPSTVSSWKTSGRIPAWRRGALMAVARDRGIDLTPAEIANVRPDAQVAA